jgi:hypothetical protein
MSKILRAFWYATGVGFGLICGKMLATGVACTMAFYQ